MNYYKIIIIGDEVIHNRAINDSLKKFLEENKIYYDAVYNYKIDNKNIYLLLEQLIKSNNEKILIVADTDLSFITISNLIIALTQDSKKEIDDIIIPNRAIKHEKHSYLLEYETNRINVMKCDFYNGITSKVLLKSDVYKSEFHIFDADTISLTEVLVKYREDDNIILNAYYQCDEWIVIKAISNNNEVIDRLKSDLLNKSIALIMSDNIAKYIIKKLSKDSKKVILAESCTGGLLSNFFTKESGSSDILTGSAVTYQNETKNAWLGVSSETLINHTAYSSETINEMLDGAFSISPNADYAIAVSGIAGPSGGTINKPIGRVYIGAKSKDDTIVREYNFNGDRNIVQQKAKFQAIKMLIELNSKLFIEMK